MGCGRSTKLVQNAKPLVPGTEQRDSSSAAGFLILPNNRPKHNEGAIEHYLKSGDNPQLRAAYIYGYMCRTTANNLFYLEGGEVVVYPCGAVGVLLNVNSNTQQFLGGGEISVVKGHSREVVALAVTQSRNVVATGESGLSPLICVWKLKDGLEPAVKLEPKPHSQGITLLAFSSNGKYLSAIDHNAEQTLYVYEWSHRTCVYTGSAAPGIVLNMSWCPGTSAFCTVGDEAIYFWSAHGSHTYEFQRERGKFNTEAQTNMMTVVQWFTNGNAVTGDLKGRLHLWTSHKEPAKFYQVLPESAPIRSLAIINEQILLGGEDCKVQVLNATFKVVRYFETPSAPVSVDMMKESVLCGLADGAVLEFGRNGRILLMDSHNFGELRGIALDPSTSETLVTTGEDNRIKTWNIVQRRAVSSGILEVRRDEEAVPGSRAVDISASGLIAVGHNDGHVTVRKSIPLFNHIIISLKAQSAGVTRLKFSKSGNLLAVGTSDGNVYVYDILASYTLFFVLESSPKAIAALEWNSSSTRLRTVDSDGIERFWDTETGMELNRDADRLMQEPLMAFSSSLQSVSGAALLCSQKAHRFSAHVQGTAWGLVEYGQPTDVVPSAYRMHGGDVVSVVWTNDDKTVLTCSAQDLAVVQWIVTEIEKKTAEHI